MTSQNLTRALEHFEKAVRADAIIASAFIGGSIAAGTDDEYSDLDLYVIVPDDDYASVFARREPFLREIGEPVYWEDFNEFGFDMVLFLLEDGTKGELSFGKASDFLVLHGGPYRVVIDRAGLLTDVQFPYFQIPIEDQKRTLETLFVKFWRTLDQFRRSVGRNRLLSAAFAFQEMRQILLQVCRMSVDFGDGGSEPTEKLLPADMISHLKNTFGPVERNALLAAAQIAIHLFQQVAQHLSEGHRVLYPRALEVTVLRQFEALKRSE
jgi:predicted nucleotidyltransferase